MTEFRADYRPAWGGGSCAACDGALALDAMKGDDGRWYCCPACAQGLPPEAYRPPHVPEPALYNRPRRFFAKRRPKELRGTRGR